ncbi:hypothetical protein [Aquipuribacter sp. MA13-6]|uniref:hypothetical protein n=1 Tax=unclassified Aquipuribacter TaxID=2635084 RepID=UPI003EEF6838
MTAGTARVRAAVAGVVVLGVVAVLAVLLLTVSSSDAGTGTTDGTATGDASAAAAQDAGPATAVAEVRDLVVLDELEGEIGFGDAYDVAAAREGTVTSVAPEGETVGSGSVLLEVDTEPTVLLRGEVPAYRALDVDSSDGEDVQQLEQALVDLGLGDGVTVDEEFTDETADAVERWETDLGRADPDGTVALGDVVFTTADVRVQRVLGGPGTRVQAATTVLEVTATERVVTLAVSTRTADRLSPGTTAEVTLPDGGVTTATVRSVAAGAETDPADPDAEATVAVELGLDDPEAAAAWDSGTVDVRVERSRTEQATAVPVEALLALAEGGYALEVVGGATTTLVAVEVGTVADGWVEVTGDGVQAGTVVVVPA